MRWIDAHAHVFDATCHLAENRRYTPSYEAPVAAYLAALDAHGIRGGVLVQPSFLGTDNTYLLAAIAQAPERLLGVAVVEEGRGLDELVELAAAGVVGIRLNTLGRPPPALAATAWKRVLDAAAELGLHVAVQAQGPAWAALLPPLLEAGVSVLIDHLGLPTTADPEHCPGFQEILKVADDRRVWIKASAPYRMPAGAATRAVARLLAQTGGGRLIWGSDWPWTRHEAGRGVAGLQDWLVQAVGGAESAELPALAGGNAARLFGF